ncbi:MAG TPA: hypothetical protein VK752_05425 [Bryobacteraceae bacterium]|jgi:hypothetical protein|nr:hypothetical protein [Bryobacteraceae bacterium]
MSDRLAIYLHDHRAGSNFAINLLEAMRDQDGDRDLANLAKDILVDVTQDRDTLQTIIDRVGESHTDLKQASAWLAEKASRMKLSHGDPHGLGTFEALETLALGILGKLSLWEALLVIAESDDRVAGENYIQLAARAWEQHARVEAYRLRIARETFSPVAK